MDEAEVSRAFDQAYDDYLAVSDVLMSDISLLLDGPLKSGAEKRNFIRASWALIEADAESLRRMVAAVVKVSPGALTSTQMKLLENERSLVACERVKESLKMGCSMFVLDRSPDFGSSAWTLACESNGRRDQVTHPKTLADLEFSPHAWSNYFQGIAWVISQFREFHRQMLKKYGGGGES